MTSGLNRRKLNDFTRTNIEGTEEVEKKDSDEDTKESNDSCCCPNSECQIGVTELLTENLNYTLRTGSSAPWRLALFTMRVLQFRIIGGMKSWFIVSFFKGIYFAFCN